MAFGNLDRGFSRKGEFKRLLWCSAPSGAVLMAIDGFRLVPEWFVPKK